MDRARRFVVKIGDRVIRGPHGKINADRLDDLCAEVAILAASGFEPIIVTSGAVACGVERLAFGSRPADFGLVRAASAVGQVALVRLYEEALSRHGALGAQVLLTRGDLADRRRYLNARTTLRELIALAAVPLVGENGPLAAREVRSGDNDGFAADVAALAGAELLILLGDVPALFEGDPDGAEVGGARRIAVVRDDGREAPASRIARETPGRMGGLRSAVEAARRAAETGTAAIIADGREPEILTRIFRGADTGTLFAPQRAPGGARGAWTAGGLEPGGRLVVGRAAEEALVRADGLPASGVIRVEGDFERGTPVAIIAGNGAEIGRGLVAYDARDLARIAGLSTEKAVRLLGYSNGEAIHRDDVVLLSGSPAGAVNGARA